MARIHFHEGDTAAPIGTEPRIICHIATTWEGGAKGFDVAISRRWPALAPGDAERVAALPTARAMGAARARRTGRRRYFPQQPQEGPHSHAGPHWHAGPHGHVPGAAATERSLGSEHPHAL